jgi:hypothetical protein
MPLTWGNPHCTSQPTGRGAWIWAKLSFRVTLQAMIRAVGAVVHEYMKPGDAYDQFLQQPAPAG